MYRGFEQTAHGFVAEHPYRFIYEFLKKLPGVVSHIDFKPYGGTMQYIIDEILKNI